MRDLTNFKARIDLYLDRVNKTQALLADSIGLTPQDLNHRLGGKGRTSLNQKNVYKIVEALAEWKAFKSRQEVRELFNLLDFAEPSPAQWGISPFATIPEIGQPSVIPQASVQVPTTNIQISISNRNRRPCPTPPPAPDHFGGRDDELEKLKALLNKEETLALTAMKGLGGIGKTTLSRKLAYDLFYNAQEKLFKAVLWKEIKPNPDIIELLKNWAYEAEPTFLYTGQSTEQLVQQVRGILENWINESCVQHTNGRILVVFDDVWDDGIEAVRVLRQACPIGSTVLITTRSGKVGAMLSAKEMTLDKLEPEKALKLLLEYLPEAAPQDLLDLAVVLDGHPLAMTLAARRVSMEHKLLQPQKLSKLIQQYREDLPIGTPFAQLELELGEKKEDNLTKSLYYSYAELKPEEQELFQALGILPYNAPFNDEMLMDIWDLAPTQIEKPRERLRLLSLLDLDEVSIKVYGGIWYRQHPLVHSYAHALLSQE